MAIEWDSINEPRFCTSIDGRMIADKYPQFESVNCRQISEVVEKANDLFDQIDGDWDGNPLWAFIDAAIKELGY